MQTWGIVFPAFFVQQTKLEIEVIVPLKKILFWHNLLNLVILHLYNFITSAAHKTYFEECC